MANSSRGTAQIDNHHTTHIIPIRTIGYGKRSLEEFLEVLKRRGRRGSAGRRISINR